MLKRAKQKVHSEISLKKVIRPTYPLRMSPLIVLYQSGDFVEEIQSVVRGSRGCISVKANLRPSNSRGADATLVGNNDSSCRRTALRIADSALRSRDLYNVLR